MIRKTIGYGMLATAAVGLGLTTWYGRHSLVPGEPAVSVSHVQLVTIQNDQTVQIMRSTTSFE